MPANAMSNSQTITESNLLQALVSYGGEQSKFVASNPKLIKTMFDLLKVSHSGGKLAGTAAMMSGASSASKAVHASPALQGGLKAASFSLSTFKTSMDMGKVFQLTSPTRVVAYLGATTIQKTGLAMSLAGGDSEKAKCYGALMELAGASAAAIALAPVTAPTGILLALTLASLSAQAYSAHLSCSGQ